MNFKFNEEFRKDNPQTVGETDSYFDLDNYKDWLEEKLDNSNNFINDLIALRNHYKVLEGEYVVSIHELDGLLADYGLARDGVLEQ